MFETMITYIHLPVVDESLQRTFINWCIGLDIIAVAGCIILFNALKRIIECNGNYNRLNEIGIACTIRDFEGLRKETIFNASAFNVLFIFFIICLFKDHTIIALMQLGVLLLKEVITFFIRRDIIRALKSANFI